MMCFSFVHSDAFLWPCKHVYNLFSTVSESWGCECLAKCATKKARQATKYFQHGCTLSLMLQPTLSKLLPISVPWLTIPCGALVTYSFALSSSPVARMPQ